MLTYALAESTAWKCCLISLFAFSPDPILPYQYTSALTWSGGPGDVPRLQISEKCSRRERGVENQTFVINREGSCVIFTPSLAAFQVKTLF